MKEVYFNLDTEEINITEKKPQTTKLCYLAVHSSIPLLG